MQFLNEDAHYLNPRFGSELGFLNKPVFEMQQKIHEINKDIGSNNRLTNSEKFQLYRDKVKMLADFKQQMNSKIQANCRGMELEAYYAMDVQLSDHVCNEVGKWCERQQQKDLYLAENNSSLSLTDTRVNWYNEMFGKQEINPPKDLKKDAPDIDFEKD